MNLEMRPSTSSDGRNVSVNKQSNREESQFDHADFIEYMIVKNLELWGGLKTVFGAMGRFENSTRDFQCIDESNEAPSSVKKRRLDRNKDNQDKEPLPIKGRRIGAKISEASKKCDEFEKGTAINKSKVIHSISGVNSQDMHAAHKEKHRGGKSEGLCNGFVNFCFNKINCKHSAKRECYQRESDISCKEKVAYNFPQCGHSLARMEICPKQISCLCITEVHFKGVCGHGMIRECNQSEISVKCKFRPCTRIRNCSHPCTNTCGEDCNLGDCKICEDERKNRLEKSSHIVQLRIKSLEEKTKNGEALKIVEILDQGDTSAEYLKVHDAVMRNIVQAHNWWPKITKIEKLANPMVNKKYEEARLKLKGNYEDLKFHGTGEDGVRGISENGFRMGSSGMYGAGIYFATDSSKSSQEIYTKGSNKLLVCSVLLGKYKTVDKADSSLSLEKLKREGFDSVFARRDTKNSGGVLNDEFIIYDPHQAKIDYIVHYKTGSSQGMFPKSTLTVPTSKTFKQRFENTKSK